MVRSVVITSDKLTTMQLKRIAKQTGIYKWERYINSDELHQWEEIGLAWIIDGIDPDLKAVPAQKDGTTL